MKQLFTILTAVVLMILGCSCSKETYSNYEMLVNAKNGWQLVDAKVILNHYGQSVFTFSLSNNIPYIEVFDGYCRYDYNSTSQLDYIITFKEDGTQIISPGKHSDPYYVHQTLDTARWHLVSDEITLLMQIPFFYNKYYISYSEEVENCQIISLTNKELVISYTNEYVVYKNDHCFKDTYTYFFTYKAIR